MKFRWLKVSQLAPFSVVRRPSIVAGSSGFVEVRVTGAASVPCVSPSDNVKAAKVCPEARQPVCPAESFSIRCLAVATGAAAVPALLSLPLVEAYRLQVAEVVAASAGALEKQAIALQIAMTAASAVRRRVRLA